MPKTKEKILAASLSLFNTIGLKQATLQVIAQEVDISVGNLAYHYKNKAEIMAAHNANLESELKEALSHYRNYPHFLDFHIQLQHIWEVLNSYKFIFVNLGEMAIQYPKTFSLIQDFHYKLTSQIEHRLAFHLQRGKIADDLPGYLSRLPNLIAHYILFVPQAEFFVSHNPHQHYFQDTWNFILPILTDTGREEWELMISPALTS
ncbi:MAG: TetR/AcrR family transcriptional regulator [Bacteroidota bacterium]